MPAPLLLAALPAIGEAVKGVLNRVLPPEKMTEKERAELELAIAQIDWQNVLGQLEVNKIEAASEHVFVSGWRPFIGWVCGAALAWTFVVGPFAAWSLAAFGAEAPPLPSLQMEHLTTILFGMLGLGAYRTYEKVQDANRRR